MITTAYTFICRQYGTLEALIALTVNTVTKQGGELIARAIAADRFRGCIEGIEIVEGTVEVAGLVGNPGEDFRERAALDKLARRYHRRFKRMTPKQREMIMPTVLRAVVPGMPLVILKDPEFSTSPELAMLKIIPCFRNDRRSTGANTPAH